MNEQTRLVHNAKSVLNIIGERKAMLSDGVLVVCFSQDEFDKVNDHLKAIIQIAENK
jgi:hypothetical protein